MVAWWLELCTLREEILVQNHFTKSSRTQLTAITFKPRISAFESGCCCFLNLGKIIIQFICHSATFIITCGTSQHTNVKIHKKVNFIQ